MDTSSTATAATSPSSPGAGNYNIPGDTSPKMDAPEEDSKFKEDEEEISITDIDMLTIEDSTIDKVPPHLESLLSSFDVNESQPADLLMGLVYGLGLECSFAAVEEVQRNMHRLRPMSHLSTFHTRNVRLLSKIPEKMYDASKMKYTLRLQVMFDSAARPCLQTAILTGDLLILTLTTECGHGKSICLSVGRYVLNSKGRPFPARFRKLPELSFRLRDEVLIPIRNHIIKKECGVLLYPGLDGLPEELYPYLYVYMDKNNLHKMANVSKRLHSTVKYYKKHSLKKK